MANDEEKELESIIKETEAPKRVSKKGNIVVKVAKLTGRTISSLKNKVKEKRLSRAFQKYNNTYREMRRKLDEANTLRVMHDKGENVTNSEVVEAYDEVASYNKRLAKYAVKLLTDDIKSAVADKKSRPIRVPKILLGKLKKVVKAVVGVRDKRKTKKLQKELVKDIKASTKEYIENSLENALFKNIDDGVLRDKPDADVIKGLATDRKAETFEEKIANLRKFISTDGNKPLYADEEIGSKEKTGTGVPPIEPKADVKKEEKNLTLDDLLKGIEKKTKSEASAPVDGATETKKEEGSDVKTESRVTVDDFMKKISDEVSDEKGVSATNESSNSDVNEAKSGTHDIDDLMKAFENGPKEENKSTSVKSEDVVEVKNEEVSEVKTETNTENVAKEAESARKREIDDIVSIGHSIDALESQLSKTNDPATKKMIENYISDLRTQLSGIAAKRQSSDEIKNMTAETEEKRVEQEGQSIEAIEVPYKGKHDDDSAAYVGKHDKKDIVGDSNVVVKKNETMRAEQISTPSTLRVTPQDIKNMEERNAKAQRDIVTGIELKKELEAQREMLTKYIKIAEATRDAEVQARALAESNATLAGEVAALSAEAAAINSDLGRSIK